jgi:hypothetical protein
MTENSELYCIDESYMFAGLSFEFFICPMWHVWQRECPMWHVWQRECPMWHVWQRECPMWHVWQPWLPYVTRLTTVTALCDKCDSVTAWQRDSYTILDSSHSDIFSKMVGTILYSRTTYNVSYEMQDLIRESRSVYRLMAVAPIVLVQFQESWNR